MVTVACDGQRTFRVFEDEVRAGPASALEEGWHGDLAQLVDGSWLLGCRLWGGEEVEVDGRAAYRVIATAGDGPVAGVSLSLVPMWWLPAVAVVDASTGRLLRLTRYRDGRAATAAGAEVGVGRRVGRLRVHAAGRAARRRGARNGIGRSIGRR